MEFRIADTFTDSLANLTNLEQSAVKQTAFDLQMNPANPGMQFHRIERARDDHFWSVRVSRDLRLIVHKTGASLLLCYVDHHDDAYAWAARRKIERHPRTGAAQLVEIRERVEEIPIYRTVEIEATRSAPAPILDGSSEDELLGYGVPEEWIDDVLAADEDGLLEIAAHLPGEASEALLQLATGGQPIAPESISDEVDAFEHPDAQRRFRILTNVEELERALDYPWEKWTVFLHPAQRHLVERTYNGPARISGSAGTGKTIVALHRAVSLARMHPKAQVLLATFSEALANALNVKLLRLVGNEPQIRDRIQVYSMHEYGADLYAEHFGLPNLISDVELLSLVERIIADAPQAQPFTPQFILAEWNTVVDAWQLDTWEEYERVPRLGRKTRIGSRQREVLWTILEKLKSELGRREQLTWPTLYGQVADYYTAVDKYPVDFAIVDESQDLSVPELRFLASIASSRQDGLFLAGDLGQRIFQQPFSWKQLGVDIRGRSYTLRINYRTSHQIRRQADKLLPVELSDVDGVWESRTGTVSVFNGPKPKIELFDAMGEECEYIGEWLANRLADGLQPEEVGVIIRSETELARALKAVEAAEATPTVLNNLAMPESGKIAVSTMHLAKGLEFRAVAVMACDDEVLPLQERVESISDMADLEDVYNTERHLLYVACTRAREHLLVTGVDPTSEFLDDMK